MVHVQVKGRLPGGGYQSQFRFAPAGSQEPEDLVLQMDGFAVLISADSLQAFEGAGIDYDERRYAGGFNVEYPAKAYGMADHTAATPEWSEPLAIAVQAVIDEKINPGLAAHNGYVRLLAIEEQQAVVEMGGGCQGCGISEVTLRQGIEVMIKEAVPGINAVIDSTDHTAGQNPYYAAADKTDSQSALGD